MTTKLHRRKAAKGKAVKARVLRKARELGYRPFVTIKIEIEGEKAHRHLPVLAATGIKADELGDATSVIWAALHQKESQAQVAHLGTSLSPLDSKEREALSTGGLDFSPLPAGARDPALEGAVQYARLLQGSLDVTQAAGHLGVNESRIRQRLLASPPTLYGIKVGGEWRLPAFQFARQGTVPGIERVFAVLPPDLGPVALETWLTHPDPDLVAAGGEAPLTPIAWLSEGRSAAPVCAVAQEL